MRSLILETSSRLTMPLLCLSSFFLLLRGHNFPGGGFVGGLMLASAFVLYMVVFGAPVARQVLRVDPRAILGFGILVAVGSAIPSLVLSQPFFTGQWIELDFGGFGKLKLGTPLLFDVGVYLIVLGFVATTALALAEE